MSRDPDGKIHVCEHCRRNTELFHFKPLDEYLCEDCYETAAKEIDMKNEAIARIAEIDKMFESATDWGSWMVAAANEREALANKFNLPQRYQARNADGSRTN